MTYQGTVQNGVIVFPDGVAPPDGTIVTVVPSAPAASEASSGETRTIWQKLADLGRHVETERCEAPSDAEPERAATNEPSIGQKLAALGRWAESQPCDLPEDLAENHDHYLHGLPKRS